MNEPNERCRESGPDTPKIGGVLHLAILVLFSFIQAGCDTPPPGRTKPFGCEIYVRGTFFDADPDKSWEICDDRNRMTYAGRTKYSCAIFLDKGSHRCKIADASWKAVNLGAWQKEFELQLDTPYGSLASEGSGDFLLEVKVTATYRFEVFAGNREKPLLVVSQL